MKATSLSPPNPSISDSPSQFCGKTMDTKRLALGDMQVSCNNCKKTFTPGSTSGSSNLKRYILKNVSNFCVCDACADSETHMLTRVASEKLARFLCEYVVKEELPFGIFENSGFKQIKSWACAANPNFDTIITKKVLLSEALAYYKEEKMIVESELSNAPGRICIGIDKWESQYTQEEFMCITACWIDHNWRLQKRIIRLFGLIWDNSDSIANEILSSLGQWNVADRVFSFILDDASYCDSLIASLKSHLQGKDALVHSGEFCHMRSYSRLISLLGQASLKLMDDVLPKIRNTLMHLKLSIPKRKKFYETARTRFGLDTADKRLCLDTFTAWDSSFLMLDSFLYYRDVLVEFVSNDMVIQVYCLTQEELALVDKLHKFLKLIYKVTKDISASNIADSSLYFYAVWKIHTELLDISNGPPSILSGMVKEMLPEFEKYWSNFNHNLACAAIFDPRFKVHGVRYCYEKLYGEARAEEIIVALKKTLFDLFEDYKQIDAVTSPRVGTSNVSSPNDDEQEDTCSYIEDIKKKVKALRAEDEKNWSELKAYLQEGRISIKVNFGVFEYWDRYGYYGPYRVLSTMARDILTMAISMAPLDSGFSLRKKSIPPSRSTLSPKKIEALACYRDWLRAKGISSDSTKDSGYVLGDEEDKD